MLLFSVRPRCMHQRALVQCCSCRCAHPPSPFVSHKMTMHLSTPSCSERVGHGAHISVCVFLVRTAISHFIRPFHCSPLWLWFLRALGDCCGGMWVVLLLQMYGILPGATTVPLPARSPLLAAASHVCRAWHLGCASPLFAIATLHLARFRTS